MIIIALTFARVFSNIETSEAYENMFTALFSIIKEDTKNDVFFYHMDNKGIKCILADVHQGQALGNVLIKKFFLFFMKIFLHTIILILYI